MVFFHVLIGCCKGCDTSITTCKSQSERLLLAPPTLYEKGCDTSITACKNQSERVLLAPPTLCEKERAKQAMATPVSSSGSAPTLSDLESCIRDKIQKYRWTHKELSEYLRTKYPGARGFSVRCIERFCSTHDLHKTAKIPDTTLDRAVTSAVNKVRLHLLFILADINYTATGWFSEWVKLHVAKVCFSLRCIGWTYIWAENYVWLAGS